MQSLDLRRRPIVNWDIKNQNKQIIPGQTATIEKFDLGLFCLHMLFLSELFGSGTRRVSNSYTMGCPPERGDNP